MGVEGGIGIKTQYDDTVYYLLAAWLSSVWRQKERHMLVYLSALCLLSYARLQCSPSSELDILDVWNGTANSRNLTWKASKQSLFPLNYVSIRQLVVQLPILHGNDNGFRIPFSHLGYRTQDQDVHSDGRKQRLKLSETAIRRRITP